MSTERERRGPRFGQRHVLILLLHVGNIVDYVMRINFSVAIVAMVNNTDSTSPQNVSTECPPLSSNVSRAAPPPGEKFAWSKELQGLALSSFFWFYFILQAPAGTLAQRYGGKWIFGFSIAIQGVLSLLTPLLARTSVYLLIAVRALMGFVRGVSYPTMVAMLGGWLPPQEVTFLLNIADSGSIVGTTVGQLTAGVLCASTFLGGWPSVFYTGGAAAFLWFLPWCLLVSDTPALHPRISDEEKQYIHGSIGSNQREVNAQGLPWKQMIATPGVWAFIITFTLSSWINYTLLTCLPQFLSEVLHFDISTNGLFASLPSLVSVLASPIFSFASDRIIATNRFSKTTVRKFFTLLTFSGVGGCIFGSTFVSCNSTLVMTLLLVGYVFYGACYAGYYTNALDISPEYAGTVYGIGNTLATFTGIVSPIITDYITKDHTIHQWNLVFYISSGTAAFAALQYLLIGSGERQKWNMEVPAEEETAPILGKETDTSPMN